MAFGFKVNGDYLDLLPGSSVSFVRNTELWVTGDPTFNEGNYTFPVDVPLNAKNKRLLRWPDRIDNARPLEKIEDCTLYIGAGKSVGVPVFWGSLYIKESGPNRAKLFMTTEGLNTKKDLKFSDVNIGEYRIPAPLPLQGLMTATCNNPLDYDFVFFPVANQSTDVVINYQNWNYQNNWVIPAGDPLFRNNRAITPFLRLEVLLKKVAEALGYNLIDNWLLHEEQRLICVYNNKSINSAESFYYDIIRYNEHVPTDMSLTDFLVKIAKWQFIGLFVDNIAKTITLQPYADVIKGDAAHNWTARTLVDYTLKLDSTLPKEIGYGRDSSDAYFSNNYASDEATLEDGAVLVDRFNRMPPPTPVNAIPGYYLNHIDKSIRFRNTDNKGWSIVQHIFKSIELNSQGIDYFSEVIPLFDHQEDFSDRHSMPRADITPTMEFEKKDENDDWVRDDKTNKLTNIRTTIFRGFRTVNNHPYPYANSSAYDPTNEAETFEHSLHYDGERGIYNRYGKEWVEFMKMKKIVNRRINLRLQDILNFREWEKVRIDNMNYFVKSLKITVTQNGIQPTECELVSIPFN